MAMIAGRTSVAGYAISPVPAAAGTGTYSVPIGSPARARAVRNGHRVTCYAVTRGRRVA